MRTTLELDDGIFLDLMRFTNAKTKTEAANLALSDWVRGKRLEKLRSLRGKIAWEGDLDQMRALEIKESETTDG